VLTVFAGLSVGLVALLSGWEGAAAIVLAVALAAAAILFPRSALPSELTIPVAGAIDYTLIGPILAACDCPAALSTQEGSLLVANPAFRERFGAGTGLLQIGDDDMAREGVRLALTMAVRDGAGCVGGVSWRGESVPVEVDKVGASGATYLWKFPDAAGNRTLAGAAGHLNGSGGQQLDDAGIASFVIDDEQRIVAANRSFRDRVVSGDQTIINAVLSDLLEVDSGGAARIKSEGPEAPALQLIHVPIDPGSSGAAGTIILIDDSKSLGKGQENTLQALLDVLPVGLALIDRDGRFLTMNKAFRQAAGVRKDSMPSYPGDLVIKDDKGAVADAVRRSTRGPAMSIDLPVRLTDQASEPAALTIAGLRGLGEAAVLLPLKDNSEEAKLKRQIAQATKMQVVGQLAGGVAHDFNNILTAIIGHCDLMLLRHTPGDSDYDDIQQIKSNSNRAAGLTRQLLAFSRQQTLRPQILQLPDVVGEVSHLLKRLLGETVELVVKHGRNVGPIRADPGQLEQVIVNLAVNARDAMAARGGGMLTIQTYKVGSDQVAELGSDILPVADYSALSVTDTGCGISAPVLSKIFEPFFTTKEVGKGTGLGLSTVYGIVKQSGGFIFADSKVDQGTRFVIYLPVHHEEVKAAKTRGPARSKKDELWGSGTILLVEDEPTVRNVAERALTRHGYTVLTADNGEEALEILSREDAIDLLISDVVMPGMDGPTVVAEARKSRPDLKILFMSGYAEEQLRKSIDLANVNFLPKPFSVSDLAEAARRAVGAK
jgi:two-component system cell cycle sensor histidine kinase/response regulator CckA